MVELGGWFCLQEALTLRPPHVILLPHPSFDFEQLSTLIERLEVGYANFVTSLLSFQVVPNVVSSHGCSTQRSMHSRASEGTACTA